MFFLCVCLIFPCVFTYEVTTKPNSGEGTDIFDVPKNTSVSNNDTKGSENNTIVTQRITQPSQSQKIERILESVTPLNSTIKVENKTSDFKPSPQLETYYEFNKFPVVPALPEAKTFGGYNLNAWDAKPTVPSWSGNQGIQNSWYESSITKNWNQNFKNNLIPSTEQPWNSRVKFPTPAVNENPYKFVNNDEKLNNYLPPVSLPTTTEGFSFNKPVETPSRVGSHSLSGLWQTLMGGGDTNKNSVATQKTFSDYNLMEKAPPYGAPVKEYEYGLSHQSPNPLTKIIKFLTTIIPIGLLLSALTPTVITVTSMNDTQSRFRSDDPKHQEIVGRLASSLKYAEQLRSCEDKILCELLVTASISKNSEEHINNLLDTFIKTEDLQSKKEDLLKVFEAVKKQDCSVIVCKSIKNPS